MGRKGIKRLLETLGRYYGGRRCVVTKSTNAHYHHLDDDSSNSIFANLIPLGSKFNCPELRDAKANSRKGKGVVLPAQLEPEALLAQSKLHFAMWDTALAYGCARLSYFIATNYLVRNVDFRVRLACHAMYFARMSVNYDLIRDILLRDMLPIAQGNMLGQDSRTSMIYEIAGILSENGRYEDANDVLGLIPEFRSPAWTTMGSATYAAYLRRRANSIIAERGLSEEARGLLSEAGAVQGDENIRAGIANSIAWSHLSDRNYSRAIDALLPMYELYKRRIFQPGEEMQAINISAWNAAEVLHSFGVAATHVGGRYAQAGKHALVEASTIYTKSGARPFLLRENFWKQEHDLHEHARVNGIAQIPVIRDLPDDVLIVMRAIIRLLRD